MNTKTNETAAHVFRVYRFAAGKLECVSHAMPYADACKENVRLNANEYANGRPQAFLFMSDASRNSRKHTPSA